MEELISQAETALNKGNWQTARACLEAALPICHATGDLAAEARILENLGRLEAFSSQQSVAIKNYQEALAIYIRLGSTADVARLKFGLAGILQAQANYTEALALLEEVIAFSQATNAPQLRQQMIVRGAIRKRLRRLSNPTAYQPDLVDPTDPI